MLAIRIDKNTEDRLTNLAIKTGRTKTFYAKEAILTYLDEMEDYYIAKDRLDNPGTIWSLDEIENEKDLEN